MKKNQFPNEKETKVYKSLRNGWEAETRVHIKGMNWMISTLKGNSGIFTSCRVVTPHSDNSFSFDMFGAPKNESFYLNSQPRGVKATENSIREIHEQSLILFDQKAERGEIAELKEDDIIKIGQVVFTEFQFSENDRRAVYQIQETDHGTIYHTVSLDGSGLYMDNNIRTISKKFGIGVYFIPGDIVDESTLPELVQRATEAEAVKAEEKKQADELAEEKAKERAIYLSQFTPCPDQATATNILKKHISETFPMVSKVSIKYESYSGGNSLNVCYHSPEEIEELESFLKSLQYGHFNSMDEIYEYSNDKDIIVLNTIMIQYQYVFVEWEESKEAKETIQTPVSASFELVEYSDKAIALFGDTKPIKDELRELGGKFNGYLKKDGQRAPGWIFSKKSEQQVRELVNI